MKNRNREFSNGLWRAASISLGAFSIMPLPMFFFTLGIWMDAKVTEPALIEVLLVLPFLGMVISLLMFTGAAIWLIFAPFWVPREIAAEFFLVDGLGWFSTISRWLYTAAYGN
jgi:hypothetical protein